MTKSSKELLDIITAAIEDKKGRRILAIDVQGVSPEVDYVLVAEGSVDRHLMAIASSIEEALKEIGEPPSYLEGGGESGWLVLDCFSVVVHLFLPDQRDKYRIENLWKKGSVVERPYALEEGSLNE